MERRSSNFFFFFFKNEIIYFPFFVFRSARLSISAFVFVYLSSAYDFRSFICIGIAVVWNAESFFRFVLATSDALNGFINIQGSWGSRRIHFMLCVCVNACVSGLLDDNMGLLDADPQWMERREAERSEDVTEKDIFEY